MKILIELLILVLAAVIFWVGFYVAVILALREKLFPMIRETRQHLKNEFKRIDTLTDEEAAAELQRIKEHR